jgi:uncharacterized low-complexity protein
MRRTIRFFVVVAAVSALPLMTGIAVAGARSAPAASASRADDQTHLQAALDALKSAEKHLGEVKGTAGGHLAPTLKATRDAIKHAEEGLKALKK